MMRMQASISPYPPCMASTFIFKTHLADEFFFSFIFFPTLLFIIHHKSFFHKKHMFLMST